MNIEQAIKLFSDILENKGQIKNLRYINPKHIECAIEALREKAARENPKPLECHTLGGKTGQPAWLRLLPDDMWQSRWVLIGTAIQSQQGEDIGVFVGGFGNETPIMFSDYGKRYLLYAHEPKEAR